VVNTCTETWYTHFIQWAWKEISHALDLDHFFGPERTAIIEEAPSDTLRALFVVRSEGN
jgi:hypothetical protein